MKPMEKLVVASKNPKKTEELKTALKGYGIEVLDMNDIEFPDVEETGSTFEENAILKAENAAKHTGLPAIADDSGICVDALDGRPGIYSARYGTYQKLLTEIADVPFGKRTAHFNCTLALTVPGKETVTFEGKVNGFILTEARGSDGFGYDPVFLPEGEQRSFAEMTKAQKSAISHRGRALEKFIHYVRS